MYKIFSRKSKKASLDLSINAIIIIVLAMTLLGLGLGFIRTQFKGITETTGQVQEQVKQQILEDLRTGDKKLSFPTERITVARGESKDIAIGVKNTQNTGDLNFMIDIFTTQAKYTDGTKVTCTKDPNDFTLDASITCDGDDIDSIDYFYDIGPFTLGLDESSVYGISLDTKDKGTYIAKLRVIKLNPLNPDPDNPLPDNPYAEKTFFVTIS